MPGPVPKQLSAEQFQGLVSDYPEAEMLFTYLNEQTRKTTQGLGNAVSLGGTLAVVTVDFTTPVTGGGEGKCVARYTTVKAGAYPTDNTTILNFDTRVFDSDESVSVGAAWRFIAKRPGDYQIGCGVLVASYTQAAGHQHALTLFKNGQTHSTLVQHFCQAAPTTLVGLYGPPVNVALVAGDYLHVGYYHTSGSDRALNTDPYSSHIDIARLHDATPDNLTGVGVQKGVQGKVQAVLVGRAQKLKSTERVPNPRITWDEDGDLIRIRSVQGLQPSTAYRLTLVVIGGG